MAYSAVAVSVTQNEKLGNELDRAKGNNCSFRSTMEVQPWPGAELLTYTSQAPLPHAEGEWRERMVRCAQSHCLPDGEQRAGRLPPPAGLPRLCPRPVFGHFTRPTEVACSSCGTLTSTAIAEMNEGPVLGGFWLFYIQEQDKIKLDVHGVWEGTSHGDRVTGGPRGRGHFFLLPARLGALPCGPAPGLQIVSHSLSHPLPGVCERAWGCPRVGPRPLLYSQPPQKDQGSLLQRSCWFLAPGVPAACLH